MSPPITTRPGLLPKTRAAVQINSLQEKQNYLLSCLLQKNIILAFWSHHHFGASVSSMLVMEGDSCSRGHLFESYNRILDGHFSIQFYNKLMRKTSIHPLYLVGFKPTTFTTRVSSHNLQTRASTSVIRKKSPKFIKVAQKRFH